jgi:integrase
MPRNIKPFHVAVIVPNGRPIELRYHCPIARRRVRKSSGTYDLKEAEEQARELEAKLRTGTLAVPNGSTPWGAFRDRYDLEEIRVHFRPRAGDTANSRLDVFEKIMQPATLGEACNAKTLMSFRNRYAAGEGSRFGSRSPHSVVSMMATIFAAFRWAHRLALIDAVPAIPRYRPPSKKRFSKGRPISQEEFQRMIEATIGVIKMGTDDEWQTLLRGLWESGLRLGELLGMSWDDAKSIRPHFPESGLPTIVIPGAAQKNREDDEIPMLPGFAAILAAITSRSGPIFLPSLPKRPRLDYVSKIVSAIGKASGVTVADGTGEQSESGSRTKDYQPPKFASAHDLRRSLADRLERAGLHPAIIGRIMRHKSYETTKQYYATGNVQRDAEELNRRIAAT